MRRAFRATLLAWMFMLGSPCFAGQYEDALSAYQAHDFAAATRLFRLEAENANASAQQFLSLLYHDDQGVARDYVRSYMWFNLAVSLYPAGSTDFTDTIEMRDLTGKSMTPGQIESARAMARKCQQSNFKQCD